MTAYAAGLGTATAAAHQIYVSLLFLTAVAVGTPLSWAAQSFMPGYLAKKNSGKASDGSDSPTTCLRALLAVGVGCAGLAAGGVVGILRFGTRLFTSDPGVVAAMVNPNNAIPLVGFVLIYPVFLALEGSLIAARRLRLSLLMSTVLFLSTAGLYRVLSRLGWLSLSALWSASTASLLLATAASLLVAANACSDVDNDEQEVIAVMGGVGAEAKAGSADEAAEKRKREGEVADGD